MNIDTSLNSQVKLGNGVPGHVKGKRTIGFQTMKGVKDILEKLLCRWVVRIV